MSASSAGLPLPGTNTHVKSEFNEFNEFNEFDMDEHTDGYMEDTREASVEDAKSNADESDEAKRLRKKREYNRIAQREFRRRRKDKMSKLEESQSITVTEQAVEIQFLRKQNDDLRLQNENLMARLFGIGWQSNANLALPPVVPSSSRRQRSSVASSASSIMESMTNDGSIMDALGTGSDMLPVNQLAMTSSMLPSAMQAFAGTMPSSNNMQIMQYSMAHPAGSRGSPQDIPGGLDFNAVASGSSSYQAMSMAPFTISSMATSQVMTQQLSVPNQQASPSRSASDRPNLIAITPASRFKTSTAISSLFSPLIHESHSFPSPTTNQSCARHLQILSNISSSLHAPFRPTATQLSTPHYYGVDLLPSPSLRDRLCRAGSDVSAAFLHEFDYLLLTTNMDEHHRLTIWGEDPYSEVGWEFSAEMLSRWGWLVGPPWAERANFWRRQRGLAPVPMPVEAPDGSLWGMWQQLRLGALGGDSMVGGAVVGLAGLGLQQQNQHHMQ